jgi:hypothetical protein
MKKQTTLLLWLVLIPGFCFGAIASSVTQWGITWYFNQNYPVGQFANGDWWVLGDTVRIDSISPAFDGTYNGWEVNPAYDRPGISDGTQGFDHRITFYDSTFVPSLPYKAKPGESIVKAVSDPAGPCGGFNYTCLKTAAVLTVVGTVPPDSGATVFRPPYVGTAKPLYSIDDLRTDLLPRLSRIAGAISLDSIKTRFERVQMNHEDGNTGRAISPIVNFRSNDRYGPNVGLDNSEGALGLMFDDPLVDKMPALIAYVQAGIDWLYAVQQGKCWCTGGPGIQPGFTLVPMFAAVMLDDENLKDIVRTAVFNEDGYLQPHLGTNPAQAVYGGESYWSEDKYWNYIVKMSIEMAADANLISSSAYKDPYGYIDGELPYMGYSLCCFPGPWKGNALAAHLMPAIKTLWDNPLFFDYVDRWVNHGYWTQPDPCAMAPQPVAGWEYLVDPTRFDTYWAQNYRITFGPDGLGGCIRDTDSSDGIGRMPQFHGAKTDGSGAYYTNFINNMWNAYRYPILADVIVDNLDAAAIVTGSWTAQTTPANLRWATNYLSDGNTGKGEKSVLYKPDLPLSGLYIVYLWWLSNSQNYADNVPVTITHAAGVSQDRISMKEWGGRWRVLGQYRFNRGTSGSVLLSNAGTTQTVIADAARFVLIDTSAVSAIPPNQLSPVNASQAIVEISDNPFRPLFNLLQINVFGITNRMVQITVTDLGGKTVRNLTVGTTGDYYTSIVWDGRDNRGTLVKGGIYYVLIESGNNRVINKIVVIN